MNTTTARADQTITRWTRRRMVKIVIDVGLLVGFLAEFITREGPDYAIHSWIGIILIPAIALHLTGSLGWIKRVWQRKQEDKDFKLGVLNAILGLLTTVCIATGFPLWLDWSTAAAWSTIHTITGFLSIVVMFVHLWMNRKRINQLRKAQGLTAYAVNMPG